MAVFALRALAASASTLGAILPMWCAGLVFEYPRIEGVGPKDYDAAV
jgi:hypothetical protein